MVKPKKPPLHEYLVPRETISFDRIDNTKKNFFQI